MLGIWNVDAFSPKIRICSWDKPLSSVFKLNVDGAAKGNIGKATGGGIIRDCKGRMLISFCNLYGLTANMVALELSWMV